MELEEATRALVLIPRPSVKRLRQLLRMSQAEGTGGKAETAHRQCFFLHGTCETEYEVSADGASEYEACPHPSPPKEG